MFSRRTTTVVTVVLVALVTVALVASALPVFAQSASALPAHTELVSTSPKDGARVGTVDEVSLTFSEEVNRKFVEVAVDGPDGDEADGGPTVSGGTVTQALAPDLPAGRHTVTYRVVSADGHPVSGSVSFTTTTAPATASPSASATPAPTTASPTAAPTTAAPTPSPSTEPAAAEGSSWALPLGLAALVALLAVVGVLLGRRRPGHDGEHPDASG